MRTSLQLKLILLLLLTSLIPLAVLAVHAYQGWRADIQERIGRALASDCQQTIDLVDRQFFFCREDVKAWAVTEAMQDVIAEDADGRISAMLRRLKAGYGIYSGIFCISPEGQIVASSEGQAIGQNVAAEDWFRQAKGSTGLTIHEMVYDPLVGGFCSILTTPIHAAYAGGEGQVVGYLSSRLNWSEMYAIVSAVQVEPEGQSETGYAVLVDRGGYVLAAPGFLLARGLSGEDRPLRVCNINLSSAGMQAVRASVGRSGFLVERDLDGHPVLAGYAGSRGYQEFAGCGWSVLVLRDRAKAFAPVEDLRRRILLLLGATLGIALLLAILFGSRISRRFANLPPLPVQSGPVTSISRLRYGVATNSAAWRQRSTP